ncbi:MULTISPECIES: YobA family protein [Bacillus cereus group]|uniref:YobA family protein n=1 Tax=Bacillus cereus group TaxID=86661 RepID=UPI0021D35F0C|nr:YobA family protein [Bacillus wiedmannii]MCU5601492.1 YobA family protein [Bacillus wiedmannii]
MFSKKQKLVTVVTTLTLGCGLVFGLTPTSADSISNPTPIKEEQVRIQIPFTGYVISADDNYLVVADTNTKEETLSYQNNWWELASQNKILRVPITSKDNYSVGEKLNIFSVGWTHSIPPIAVMPVIEKIIE